MMVVVKGSISPWAFTVLTAIVCLGVGAGATLAGATTSPTTFCEALKPAILGGQRIPSILGKMSDQPLATTKRELITAVNPSLKTPSPVKAQLRSAPKRVRDSYSWDVSVAGRFKAAIQMATTRRQIRAAALRFVGSPSRQVPFITYELSQCEQH
jgi:hypothetical protein